jgi:prepilin-type processing-associated H-X9-DG protein
MALIMYASEWKGRFPPERLRNRGGDDSTQKMEWYDQDRIGKYLPKVGTFFNSTGDPGRYSIAGPVMYCPAYAGWNQDVGRCYGINVWASCTSDQMTASGDLYTGQDAAYGRMWDSKTKGADQLILITEIWAPFQATMQSVDGANLGLKWVSGSFCGIPGNRPGERFGVGSGAFQSGTGLGTISNSQLVYFLHRSNSQKSPQITDIKGRVNIGYADGHVSLKSASDLADATKKRSTFDSLWSPKDRDIAEGTP